MCAKWDRTRRMRVRGKKASTPLAAQNGQNETTDKPALCGGCVLSFGELCRVKEWKKRHKSRECLLLSSSLSSLPHDTLFFCLLILKTPCIMTLRVGICFSFHQKKTAAQRNDDDGVVMCVATTRILTPLIKVSLHEWTFHSLRLDLNMINGQLELQWWRCGWKCKNMQKRTAAATSFDRDGFFPTFKHIAPGVIDCRLQERKPRLPRLFSTCSWWWFNR